MKSDELRIVEATKALRTWEEQLKQKEQNLINREIKLKSDYKALISANAEIEKKFKKCYNK